MDERLPRGRHRLPKEEVAASQRRRMIEALVALVAERGFRATTVAEIVAAAGVSRRSFYEHFDDRESCFLTAFDEGVAFLLAGIRTAVGVRGADWRTRARTSVEAYLEGMAGHPDFAWVFTFESLAAGPVALERRAAVLQRWVAQWRRLHDLAREEQPDLPPVSDSQLLVLVAGIEELVRECLRVRGAAHLRDVGEPATAAAIAVLGGTG